MKFVALLVGRGADDMATYVVSDIHGDSKCLSSALKTLESYDISFYLLLGDLINHGPRNGLSREYNPLGIPELLNPLRHKIIAVRGNCDSEVDQKLCEFPLTAPVNTLIIHPMIDVETGSRAFRQAWL